MRVLVTGATGFIGRALVPALVRLGSEVRAATRAEAAGEFPPGVEVVRHGDLAAGVDWAPCVAGVDVVVHLAGIAHAGPGIPERDYDRVNHRATAELAQAARRAGITRFVFISSIRAQSGPAADRALTEGDDPRPTDAYGASKLAAEWAVQQADVPFTILRPVLIYGPGMKGNFLTLARLAALPVPLPFGACVNRRSLVDREGVLAAISFVLRSPATAGEVYLVADPTPISLADIIAALRRGLGRGPGLVAVPRGVLRAALRLTGKDDLWNRLGGALVADPKKLIAAGWPPPGDTAAALEHMAKKFV